MSTPLLERRFRTLLCRLTQAAVMFGCSVQVRVMPGRLTVSAVPVSRLLSRPVYRPLVLECNISLARERIFIFICIYVYTKPPSIVDPSQSNTVTELGSGFSIRYVTPGSGIVGNYIADSFRIGEMSVQNLTMAVATSARYIDTGIMGIGFDTDESLPPGRKTYPNIIDDMMTQGLINTRSYSLWLDDLGRTTSRNITCENTILTRLC
jgi:Eukaryotic aspartyl protease